jgi:glycosyltransferase involved in cell wall biosynthesis
MNILQINTCDLVGGAAQVSYRLHNGYRRRGNDAKLLVGSKQSTDSAVIPLPLSAWGRLLQGFINRVEWRSGWQYLLQLTPLLLRRHTAVQETDIINLHNIHGDYFNLRDVAWLARRKPVVWTLHDMWPLTGHCAHSFDCERWKSGCGRCPDLTIDPAIRRDATAYNWRRKREIYANSRLYIATPCQWLMQKVKQSILGPAIVEARVIPHGVDLAVFHPAGDRQAVRAALGIPIDTVVLLFAANSIRQNIWKDCQTMQAAIVLVAEHLHGRDLLFIALGEDAPTEQVGQAEIHFVPYRKDPEAVARYYQAADVYVHAARADTFPNTVLEALACGAPVVATAVGGIPEQVEDGLTGFLVPPGDAGQMAERIGRLLNDDDLRRDFSRQAAESARRRFDLERQVNDYLTWYRELTTISKG